LSSKESCHISVLSSTGISMVRNAVSGLRKLAQFREKMNPNWRKWNNGRILDLVFALESVSVGMGEFRETPPLNLTSIVSRIQWTQ